MKRLVIGVALFCTMAMADFDGVVTKVSDGDTLRIVDEVGTVHKVRLLGIDAPEKKQPYGEESTRNLANMVLGSKVTVESKKKDMYGRDLGTVYFGGQDINAKQLKDGAAWYYRQYARDISPTARVTYDLAEKDAISAKKGLWALENPVNPAKFRQDAKNKGKNL